MATTTNGNRTKTKGRIPTDMVALAEVGEAEVTIPITGRAMLVVHKFSDKARDSIADKQAGKKTAAGKGARKPEEEWLEALYVMPSCKYPAGHAKAEYGFPAVAFKKAMVRAAKTMEGITMTDARGLFFVMPDEENLARIVRHTAPVMRTDAVRLASGVTSLAHRPQFDEWGFDLRIEYNPKGVTVEQLAALLNIAGFGVGIGENRPEKSGDAWGRFRVLAK